MTHPSAPTHSHDTDHQTAWESLPWVLNGTLEGPELQSVERHVQSCVACRGELQYLRELSGLLQTAEELPLTPTQGLSALMARIDSEDPAEATKGGHSWLAGHIRSWIEPLRQATPGLRCALLAQAAAIVMLLGVITWPNEQAPEASHRTLSDAVTPAVGSGLNIRVVFSPETPESQIRAILGAVQAEIISGPTPLGVYTLQVPVPGERDLTAGAVLAELRARPELTFAELAAR